jgi:cytochrome P450
MNAHPDAGAHDEAAAVAGAPDELFNPLAPGFSEDPYPAYARLRAQAPVHRSAMGFWAVACYDDVVHVLKTPQTFSSRAMGITTVSRGEPVRTIINTDPPEHTQIRNLVNRAFTPRMVADMEPRIREITRDLLDRALPSGGFDAVRDLAVPLPVTVIAEILGVDPARRDDFKRWSSAIVDGSAAGGQERMQADRTEFWEFFSDLIDERRRAPTGDLISAVLKAEEQDLRLTHDEIIAFTMLLLVAGNETTTNLIGNALLALTAHPEQLDAVIADRSLIPNMVEEALRYEPPVQFLFRQATHDVELGGQHIEAGATVIPIFASANRDDARFPEAARFDIRRNAQGHLAFGLGPHFCLGAPLARLEARVAFEELFARVRTVERADDKPPERIDSLFLRGLRRLELRVSP